MQMDTLSLATTPGKALHMPFMTTTGSVIAISFDAVPEYPNILQNSIE
jgi:hypothetical protein